jgi:hypothetical protein
MANMTITWHSDGEDTQCPWSIRWTFGTDTRCDKPAHVIALAVTPLPDGRISAEVDGDEGHSGPAGNGVTRISWQAGDRREFTGDWPGPCAKLPGCVLHTGHHGRCAP